MITLTENAIQKLNEICPENKYVRLAIVGGGCAGFSKLFDFSDTINEDDNLFYNKFLIDQVSLDIIQGAVIDFKKELTGEFWDVSIPSAQSSCGCGVSFSL